DSSVAKTTGSVMKTGRTVNGADTHGITERSAVRNIKGGSRQRNISNSNSKGTMPLGNPKNSLQKSVNLSPKPVESKRFKVLQNGAVSKNELAKKKKRVINHKKAAKLQKAKLKKLKKQRIRFEKQQSQLIGIVMGGFAAPKKADISKAVGGAKKAVNLAKKPVEVLKRQFYSQADKSDDTGVKAAKLGLQVEEYGTSALKTAVHTGAKTVKGGAKITKRVYRKIHKPTSAELRRRL
ncbi:MAG: hypothetical protein K2O14_03125, partial [Oscillospiraceae bacterium]|nr:hypothetical protein [Oscillospiraceae bacterium]